MDQTELWKYDLNRELEKVQKGEANQIEMFVKSYPLCSLSNDKKAFVIIRSHASIETDDKIETLGLPPWNDVIPTSTYRSGLTFVDYDNIYEKSKRNLTFHLPNKFNYKSVSLDGMKLKIEYDDTSVSLALFQLFSGHAEKTEEYLTNEFNKLINPPDPEPEVKKSTRKTLPSKLFGTFHYKKQEDEYEGYYQLGEHKIQINIFNWEEVALKKFIANTERLIEDGLYDKVIDAISDDLIKLYNEDWTQDGEQIDKVELLHKISCETINIYEDGSLVFYFEDGDLFGGHYIQVDVSFNGEIDGPILAG